ncbi:hypothetical protein J6524_08795 [Bradyrhizobium sp. WSM 1738]|nr:hypothetical protein [Bradyrhizobium hereditatis]
MEKECLAWRSIWLRRVREAAYEVYGSLLKFGLQFGCLDALDNELAIEWPRLVIAFHELFVLLGQAGELGNNNVLRTWCDGKDLSTVDIDRPRDRALIPVFGQPRCILVDTVDIEAVLPTE